MESFVDLDRRLALVPGPVVTQLGRVDVGRGREELYTNQMPSALTALADRARIESITASSALEGVRVASPARAAAIINGSAVLRNRSEQEFAGYRSALDYLFAGDWRPLNLGLLLHLHRLLLAETPVTGGRWKDSDNLVVDRAPDGTVAVRYVPVPAVRTEYATAELVERFRAANLEAQHHPILLVGLFVLDLLTIHPFSDGNGRVARALTNALLDDAGYTVGRYVSLEQLIGESADAYYATLLASTHGWHERQHDPWPWLTYFVTIMAQAYDRFEQSARSARPTSTKQERVRRHVLERKGQFFTVADLRAALPGISDQTIRLTLNQLKQQDLIVADGPGRSATWRRLMG